ncbi:transcription elongation factor GreA [Candidatus Nomurabacteria bacterium]|nr:transcription elongation factor GreA [Candidatus Nomurabacteria bacterium]
MVQYPITQQKKESLEHELHTLTHVDRPDILKRLDAARSLGDLKENAEYHAMRDAQGKNEARIAEIQEILKHAVIVEKSDSGIIGLASEVVVIKKDADVEQVFTIVGPQEANILEGKIGDNSPLGQALIGKSEGDTALFETPKGAVEYFIKKVQ